LRKALSEYYSETENDPQLVDIWAELEATYHDRAGPSITLTNAEGENRVASLSFDNMQKEAHRRESSQDKKTTALTPRPSQSDYAKVAKQVREWSFRFDGAEKPFEFLEQVEWSANTYGLDLDMIPRAMPELLKGRALKWFIANNKQWRTWAEFIESFHTYFLPRDFFTRLADQVRQRKQGFSESFKDYMIDMQTMVRPLNYSTKETLRVIKENCTPSLRIFLKAYKVSDLDTLMILAYEYEELEKEREVFAQENKFSKTKSASPTQVTCRRCEETDSQDIRGNDPWSPPHQARRQQATDAEAIGHNPHRNRDIQTIPCGGRQATHRGHKMPPILQTRRRPVENAV